MDYMYYGKARVEPNPAKEGAFIVALSIEHDPDDPLRFFVLAPQPVNGLLSLQPLAEEVIVRDVDNTTVRLTPDRGERMIFVLSGRNPDAITRITMSYLVCDGQVIEIPGMLDLVD